MLVKSKLLMQLVLRQTKKKAKRLKRSLKSFIFRAEAELKLNAS
jgi:hypothetical protein